MEEAELDKVAIEDVDSVEEVASCDVVVSGDEVVAEVVVVGMVEAVDAVDSGTAEDVVVVLGGVLVEVEEEECAAVSQRGPAHSGGQMHRKSNEPLADSSSHKPPCKHGQGWVLMVVLAVETGDGVGEGVDDRYVVVVASSVEDVVPDETGNWHSWPVQP